MPSLRLPALLRRLAMALGAAALLPATLPAQRPAGDPGPMPAWTRGATCYEVFVRSFADSDGDGVGDLRGLTARLDYLNDGDPRTRRDLGVRCLWLMPIMESPSYHGYDVVDYTAIDREFGTAADFRTLVREARRRGIRVIVDMVPNHTSEDHPWFRAALQDPASPYRSWYRFAPVKGPDNEWGDNNWHRSPLREEYYYGFFWKGMPDLDWATPAVGAEMRRIATFWLRDMGVDGFRLDAVRHLMEDATRAANAPGTHAAMRDYAAHVRATKPGAITIGEVFDSLGALLAYYPDQLDSYFAFELGDSIVAGVRAGRGRGVLAPVLRLQARVPHARWSPFLRNHDQPRTVTELGGDRKKARVAATLLLTMPGLPFLYYGEEIGMTGAKPDERIRTPMQWTAGRGAGFTTGTPWQRLADDSATVTVEAQDRDPASLLNHHRRLVQLRADHPALGAGTLVPLEASDDAVVAYLRRDGERAVLVVANLAPRALTDVTLAAAAGTLTPGARTVRDLLGGTSARPPRVGEDGAIEGWIPLPRLGAQSAYVLDVRRAPARTASPSRGVRGVMSGTRPLTMPGGAEQVAESVRFWRELVPGNPMPPALACPTHLVIR